jgi:hypothetical protein
MTAMQNIQAVPQSYPHSPERYAADVARAHEYIGRNPLPAIVASAPEFARCAGCGSAWSGKGAEAKRAGHSCIVRMSGGGVGMGTGQ